MDPKVYVATGSDDGLAKVWQYSNERGENKIECRSTLFGHTAGITSVSWNPRGDIEEYHVSGGPHPEDERLLTSSKDQTLKLWKPFHRYGHQCRTIPEPMRHDVDVDDPGTMGEKSNEDIHKANTQHTDYIISACWRPAGPADEQVLSCSDDSTACIWDVATGQRKFKLGGDGSGHSGPVSMATWSEDGGRILTCGYDQQCIVWSPKNGHHIKLLPSQPVQPGSKDASNKCHAGPIWSARFSPGGGHEIVTASKDHTARTWDCNTGQCTVTLCDRSIANAGKTQSGQLLTHSDIVFGACYNPYEPYQILTWSMDGTAKVWDKRDRKVSVCINHHSAAVWSACFGNEKSNGGRMILTASHDMSALVYDQRLTMPKNSLLGHTGILWQASFSDDDQYVVTCSEDRTARLWNLTTGERRPPSVRLMDPVHPHKQAVTCAAFRPPAMLPDKH